MKLSINTQSLFKSFAVVAACGIMAFGCESSESVKPKTNPELAALGAGDTIHQTPANVCGSVITGRLVDASGNASSGDLLGPESYGTFSAMRADSEMIVTYELARGYFASEISGYYGPANAIPRTQPGNVDAENLPLRWGIIPSRNVGEVIWPYNEAMLCPNDIVFVGSVTISQLDFLGNSFGETPVYFEGTAVGNDGWQSFSFCAELCPGQTPPGGGSGNGGSGNGGNGGNNGGGCGNGNGGGNNGGGWGNGGNGGGNNGGGWGNGGNGGGNNNGGGCNNGGGNGGWGNGNNGGGNNGGGWGNGGNNGGGNGGWGNGGNNGGGNNGGGCGNGGGRNRNR